MKRHALTKSRSAVVLIGLGLLLAACSVGVAATPSTPIFSPTATPGATTSLRQVSEADNGRSVTVPVGSEVTVVLGNTYWQIAGSSDPAVLVLVSGPTASAAGMTACVPGAGCGTASAVFRAVAPGRATITASRTTCGEALRCTGTAGVYEVTIVVGG
jgi:hypothetical protein